jgi:apolipoprotein N-acyltransferase
MLMVLAGALHATSLAWPLNSPALQFPAEGLMAGQAVGWLNLISLTLLARGLFSAPTTRQTALRAWCFASAMLMGSWWWLTISMHTYGNLPAWLAWLGVLVLASSVALIYAGAGYALGHLSSRLAWLNGAVTLRAVLQRASAFAALALLAELTRGSLFTGFPWGSSGYAHVNGELAKLAPFVGVYGMGAAAAFVAALLAQVFDKSTVQWRPLAVAGALLMAVTLSPHARFTESAGTLQVTLLQGNIAQDEKFKPQTGVPTALAWYKRELLAARTPLVMAPETAIPLLPQYLAADYLPPLQAKYQTRGPDGMPAQLALVGIPTGDPQKGYANSVVNLLSTYQYDKHHLVPFGEFVPPLFRWLTDILQIPMANFSESKGLQAPIAFAGQRIAPNICYEDLFGEEMGPLFANPESAPTLLANFSNIAWFGNTVAIDQHRSISRLRALEFERPMLRSTNTGATVIINQLGQVTHELPRHTQGALVGPVEGRTGLTVYAWLTAKAGLLWLWGAAALVCLVLFFTQRRKA